jgi:HTH-type transcriptional repressor of NAD biosynthesis genes
MIKYKTGFYGGKFFPFHKGHDYCIRTAAEQCEKVYVILFYGGDDELRLIKEAKESDKEMLSLDSRMRHLTEICKHYANVEVHLIDVTNVKNPDGTEDWDGETPLVLAITGKMDAVYSSEPSYDAYFKRAYPWAKHILVDPPREHYPISATKIREMKTQEERSLWIL